MSGITNGGGVAKNSKTSDRAHAGYSSESCLSGSHFVVFSAGIVVLTSIWNPLILSFCQRFGQNNTIGSPRHEGSFITMKTIRIKCLSSYSMSWDPILDILAKHYRVEQVSDPDFLLCMVPVKSFEYCRYDAVRIFWSGENYSPDFNTMDYAMGFDELTYHDRYLRWPVYMTYGDTPQQAEMKHLSVGSEILRHKDRFCNFIYSHQGQLRRGDFLRRLSEYKSVDSAGTLFNNMPDGWCVRFDASKIDFQRRCKFTVAFESCALRGFTTEKIVHAFAAQTVPIYLGNPDIAQEFQPGSFINGNDFPSWDALIQRVIEVDQNDELYLSMLRTPAFQASYRPSVRRPELERFLVSIFDQDRESAYRRPRYALPLTCNERLATWGRVPYTILRIRREWRRFWQRITRGKQDA